MTVKPACKWCCAHGGAEHGLVPDVLSLEDLLPQNVNSICQAKSNQKTSGRNSQAFLDFESRGSDLPFRAVLLREDRVDHGDLLRPDRTLDAGVFEACADDAAETVGATQPQDSCSIGPSVGDQEPKTQPGFGKCLAQILH